MVFSGAGFKPTKTRGSKSPHKKRKARTPQRVLFCWFHVPKTLYPQNKTRTGWCRRQVASEIQKASHPGLQENEDFFGTQKKQFQSKQTFQPVQFGKQNQAKKPSKSRNKRKKNNPSEGFRTDTPTKEKTN